MLPRLSLSLLLVGATVPVAALGAETQTKQVAPKHKSAPPDIKFLEYLGTLEGDDENWTEIAALALAKPEGSTKPEGSATKSEADAKPAAEKK